jgi:hypothetical protein
MRVDQAAANGRLPGDFALKGEVQRRPPRTTLEQNRF